MIFHAVLIEVGIPAAKAGNVNSLVQAAVAEPRIPTAKAAGSVTLFLRVVGGALGGKKCVENQKNV